MNNIIERIGLLGIVPVVSIEDSRNAKPLAAALKAGGIPCMEITLRTAEGLNAISEAAKLGDDLLVGAGSVITESDCKAALEAGAKFIVSPGFDRKVVEYCVERGVPVLPGCATAGEIMQAMALGLDTVKFFPATAGGGLPMMKALSGPFPRMKFVPTGGINAANMGEYLVAPFVCAVGGSWLCEKSDVAAGNFDRITQLCRESKRAMLGFEFAHMGINMDSKEASLAVCSEMADAFGLKTKEGSTSNFAGASIEVTNYKYPGAHGHIAIRTNSVLRAIAALKADGYEVDMESAKYKGDRLIAVYLTKEFGGFAVHLLQK